MEHYFEVSKWARRVYGGCKLGDKRRTKLTISLAATLASQPSAPLTPTYQTTPHWPRPAWHQNVRSALRPCSPAEPTPGNSPETKSQ